MTSPFAWFDHVGSHRDETADFFSKTFGWKADKNGPMTFLTKGDGMPFGANCDDMEGVSGWVPYVEVDDLLAEVAKAKANGAVVIAENLQGPAGVSTFIADPGGAPIALWKRAEGM